MLQLSIWGNIQQKVAVTRLLPASFSCLKNSSVKSIIELKNVEVLLGKDFLMSATTKTMKITTIYAFCLGAHSLLKPCFPMKPNEATPFQKEGKQQYD